MGPWINTMNLCPNTSRHLMSINLISNNNLSCRNVIWERVTHIYNHASFNQDPQDLMGGANNNNNQEANEIKLVYRFAEIYKDLEDYEGHRGETMIGASN